MKFKVALTHFYPHIPVEESIIKDSGAELVRKMCGSEEDLIDLALDADALVIITTALPVGRSTLEKLPKCRMIANIGVGYENLDIESATEKGICVSYTPDYCIDEVADHTMGLILACSKKIVPLSQVVKDGKWDAHLNPVIAGITNDIKRLRGQTLGLVGLGNIGTGVATRAKSFGFRVIAYDPYISSDVPQKHGVEIVSFDRLLEESDFLSIHSALTKENYHMFGIEQFKLMKPGAYLINTARGGLVDHNALYTALSENYIAGAALDATEPEPINFDSPLLKLDNIIITPHSAAYSIDAFAELWRKPLEEVARVLKGGWPRPEAFLNPEVKEHFMGKWG